MSDDREVLARLRRQLAEGLPENEFTVSGGSGRYQIDAVGAMFGELSAVKRQQAVYRCINDLIREGTVHAVTIVARTPEERDAQLAAVAAAAEAAAASDAARG